MTIVLPGHNTAVSPGTSRQHPANCNGAVPEDTGKKGVERFCMSLRLKSKTERKVEGEKPPTILYISSILLGIYTPKRKLSIWGLP